MGKRNYNRETLAKSNVLALLLLTAGVFSACSHDIDLTRPATQDNVGVQMARMNLWREAKFRFQRAVDMNPKDAMAHNNLAVAYEANGDFDKAAKEYREALRLDRSNTYIQKNYSRFTEFMSRSKKRTKAATATASANESAAKAAEGVAGAATPSTPATAATSPAPQPVVPAPAQPATPPVPPPAVQPVPPPTPPPSSPPGGAA